VRDLAEKTDMGRLASPSLLKLIYDSAKPNGKTSEGRLSTDLWNEIEQLLEVISKVEFS
jgi:arsenite-transporting ATPase